MEEGRRAGAGGGGARLALLAGALVGIGGMTRYAFAWMIIPVALYVAWVCPRARLRLCLALAGSFLVVMTPWLARNFAVSGACFGTAGYTLAQDTPPLQGDRLERSLNPENDLKRVSPLDLMDKFLANAREMWRDQLPRFGGNWVSAFFLVGLLIPFHNPALGRLRLFLVFSAVFLFIVQALGQTHLSADAPEVNSENLLVLLAPLVFVYGVALFYILLDQLNLVTVDARGAAVGGFILLMCVPFVTSLLLGRAPAANSPYSPLHIQRTARLMRPGNG
jgi:4-amino-4-deoxy-L-arabinose transferase-like glycosyltransferase